MSIPQAMLLVNLSDGTTEYSITIMDGSCVGGMEETLFGPVTVVLILILQPIVVAMGFGLWALPARSGHRLLAMCDGSRIAPSRRGRSMLVGSLGQYSPRPG
ncbi:hypothetical protein ACIHFD_04615 [Nonomuraea sp. NPDC051941]|uniref:hypothetical protein n=1 Tax=Nonomuraea sp. NPDC051941 TaxID=3364373 RepID=UPI0037C66852